MLKAEEVRIGMPVKLTNLGDRACNTNLGRYLNQRCYVKKVLPFNRVLVRFDDNTVLSAEMRHLSSIAPIHAEPKEKKKLHSIIEIDYEEDGNCVIVKEIRNLLTSQGIAAKYGDEVHTKYGNGAFRIHKALPSRGGYKPIIFFKGRPDLSYAMCDSLPRRITAEAFKDMVAYMRKAGECLLDTAKRERDRKIMNDIRKVPFPPLFNPFEPFGLFTKEAEERVQKSRIKTVKI